MAYIQIRVLSPTGRGAGGGPGAVICPGRQLKMFIFVMFISPTNNSKHIHKLLNFLNCPLGSFSLKNSLNLPLVTTSDWFSRHVSSILTYILGHSWLYAINNVQQYIKIDNWRKLSWYNSNFFIKFTPAKTKVFGVGEI